MIEINNGNIPAETLTQEDTKITGILHDKTVINSSERLSIFDISSIIRCESDNDSTILYYSNGRKIKVITTIEKIEKQFAKYSFLRIHKSHLINTEYIEKYEINEECVVLNDGSKIPVSVTNHKNLFDYLSSITN